jgi:hypothetical protein
MDSGARRARRLAGRTLRSPSPSRSRCRRSPSTARTGGRTGKRLPRCGTGGGLRSCAGRAPLRPSWVRRALAKRWAYRLN